MDWTWIPENFINLEKIKNLQSYAVIVLNRPVVTDNVIVESLWNHASIRLTVDGGTNHWLTWLRSNKLEDSLKHPNIICGDLDSCNSESIKFFSKSRVIQTIDQDETDFTKSLRVLEPFVIELNLENIVVLCDSSGRLDQIIANLNTLYKNHLKKPEISRPVFMLAANSLSWLLAEGQHKIHIPEQVKKLWCALIPFEPTKITTKGLKWNLNEHTMKFGGMVSTSNTYDSSSTIVNVTSDHPLLWSMGISRKNDE